MIPEHLSKALETLFADASMRKQVSELGFFSKPLRLVAEDGSAHVAKLYRPFRNAGLSAALPDFHDRYVEAMRAIGIRIPETHIGIREKGSKKQLIIIQAAYAPEELVRTILETCDEERFLSVLEKLLDDTLLFWKHKPATAIGFHPTLRNYALRDGILYYFDTFPPMLMPQQELNRLILRMIPLKISPSWFLLPSVMNRVSDEYYQQAKMVTGIIGSCCRLRPELAAPVLSFARTYIQNDTVLAEDQRKLVSAHIENPPQLPAIWIFVRKMLGKKGKPNIRASA